MAIENNVATAEEPTRVEVATNSLPMKVLVHMSNFRNLIFTENQNAGAPGERLEGFQLWITPPVPGLSLRYMAHLQDVKDDLDFVNEGEFIGTINEGRRLEGFAIQLTGDAAARFDVAYKARLADPPQDTGLFFNGEFCGTRGQSRRIESILVRIVPK